MQGGLFGNSPDSEAAPAPADDHPLRRAMEHYGEVLRQPDPAGRVEAFRPILDIAAENVWTLGIATPPPELAVVDKNLRNVPERAVVSAAAMSPANLGMETFFFETPSLSTGSSVRLKQEMTTLVPAPGSVPGPDTSGSGLGSVLRTIFWLVFLGVLVLLGLRHPFIGRRLMIMIPTLLIVSVVSFLIIHAPPSDFLQMRITQLEMQGDPTAREQAGELREMFHLDKPLWDRYLRWMGFRWFLSFEEQDSGLLQGNMGRSMETSTPVNQLLGDRIVLTVLISLGSLLLTVALALPIGIYSAVRQHSLGDHVFSVLSFLGLCLPNFLLALLVIFLAHRWFGIDAIGLFSPEFATQASWDWPKFFDLLCHIWVPVLVVGLGGSAAMIRVMRGNLLDELHKPYVTTARAKGLGPVKLLLKHPVRLALNPLISGIGGIFPQLVSGGALVAIVLSLPTVGPLMLNALLTQDTYLAGSLLMVLSLLGILGTLVSDLLLLWLDPRIRMEGGRR